MATQDDLEQGQSELDQTSTEQTGTTTQVRPTQQPDWRKDPEYVRQQANLQREAASAKKAAWEAQNRAAAIERQFQEDRLSRMTEQEQLVERYRMAVSELNHERRQRELDAYAIQRKYDLDQIANTTGVDRDELEDIEKYPTSHDAWVYATSANAKKKSSKRSRQDEIEDEADNRVDVAGSKSTTKAAQLQAKYNAARTQYNQREQIQILAEADSLGIALKE
jgi:hypothetical protein